MASSVTSGKYVDAVVVEVDFQRTEMFEENLMRRPFLNIKFEDILVKLFRFPFLYFFFFMDVR